MKRLLIPALVLLMAFGGAPTMSLAASAPVPVLETNPVGELRWMPGNANEKATGFGIYRLVVAYDEDMLAKGTFGLKLFTTAVLAADGTTTPLQVVGHSPSVTTLEDQGAPAELSNAFAGFAGDVRDGDCANVGTEEFSAAYTTTRTVDPAYQVQECETAEPVVVNGETVALNVTTHVPGFWVDIDWPLQAGALDQKGGHALAEVWYGAVYDTNGGDGNWFTEAEGVGNSVSVYSPGTYHKVFTFTATPGGMAAPECHDWIPQNAPNSFQELEFEITQEQIDGFEAMGVKGFTFALYPKGDWDFFVDGPGGMDGEAGNFTAHETVDTGLAAGTWKLRGCNFAGDPHVPGAVVLRF